MDQHSQNRLSALLKLFLFCYSRQARAYSSFFNSPSNCFSLLTSFSSFSRLCLSYWFSSCSWEISRLSALFYADRSAILAWSWLTFLYRSRFSSLVLMYFYKSISLNLLWGLSMVAQLEWRGLVLMVLAVGGAVYSCYSVWQAMWLQGVGGCCHSSFLTACRNCTQSLRISSSEQYSMKCLIYPPISSRVMPISLETQTTSLSRISSNCLFLPTDYS